ncbi:MAG: AAA family ATPase [Pseudomonadota bacterium]
MADDIFNFNNVTPLRQEDLSARKERIRETVHDRIESYVEFLLPNAKKQGNGYRVGDIDGSHGSSLMITTKGNGIGRWYDHADTPQGDIFTLWAEINHLNVDRQFEEVLDQIESWLGGKVTTTDRVRQAEAKAKPKKREQREELAGEWIYETAQGDPFMIVKRFDKFYVDDGSPVMKEKPDGSTKQAKGYRPFHADGRAKLPLLPSGKRIIFNLPGIATANEVIVTEGEKAAHALNLAGFTATTHHGGSSIKPEVSDWTPLAGKSVILWPDNDENGIEHMARLSSHLKGLGCSVRVINVPEGHPEGWDAADAESEEVSTLLGLAEKRKPVSFQTIDDMFDMEEPEWMIEGMMVKCGTTCLVAPPATYKSFLSLHLGMTIACGHKWQGKDTKGGPVIYVASEGGGAFWAERIIAWVDQNGHGELPPLYTSQDIHNFMDEEAFESFVEGVEAVCENPALIIIDTMSLNYEGDEQSNDDMNAYMKRMRQLALRTNTHVMLVHHTGKDIDRGGRGASSRYGALDHEYTMSRDEYDDQVIHFKCTKNRHGRMFWEDLFRMEEVTIKHPKTGRTIESLVAIPEEEAPQKPTRNDIKGLTSSEWQIVKWIGSEGAKTTSEVMEKFDLKTQNARKKLRKARDFGAICCDETNREAMWFANPSFVTPVTNGKGN